MVPPTIITSLFNIESIELPLQETKKKTSDKTYKATLAISTHLLVFVKNFTLRVQTAPLDRIAIDFWRSRKHLHVSNLPKTQNSKVGATFFRR